MKNMERSDLAEIKALNRAILRATGDEQSRLEAKLDAIYEQLGIDGLSVEDSYQMMMIGDGDILSPPDE